MTARVITDPSALGWVLDPDTGRWEWSGSGDGGGSGGGGAWELVEKLSGVGVSAFEFDLNPDEFHAYRFFVDVKPDIAAEFWMQLGSEGAWITSSEYTTEYFVGRNGNFAGGTTKAGYWKLAFSSNEIYGNASHWEVKLTGLGIMPPPATLYNKPAISYLGAGGQSKNETIFWTGSGSLNYQTAPIDKVRLLPKSPVTWAGSVTMEGMRSEP